MLKTMENIPNHFAMALVRRKNFVRVALQYANRPIGSQLKLIGNSVIRLSRDSIVLKNRTVRHRRSPPKGTQSIGLRMDFQPGQQSIGDVQ